MLVSGKAYLCGSLEMSLFYLLSGFGLALGYGKTAWHGWSFLGGRTQDGEGLSFGALKFYRNRFARWECFPFWVAPCHFCTFLPDQFFLALFCLNIVSWIPCGAFWPNLATSAHFKGLFYPWMDSGVNLGPKFQLKPWANFSNFFGSFCT